MKMVKNIAILALAGSFMFAGVSFHMANNYSALDAAAPTVGTSYGASWSLNDNTSVGFDSNLGMLMTFGVGNASLRMGWNSSTETVGEGDDAVDVTTNTTSVGLGFTWWSGGDGLNTSISTNYDMVGTGDDADGTVSMVVGFGF
jgi:hypothetical protein